MNSFVGEMTLELEGKMYILRPSFDCLTEIESLCGDGIMNICASIGQNQIKAKHVAAILYGGIIGGTPFGTPPPFSFENFKSMLVSASYSKLATLSIMFLNRAMKGRQIEGESEVPAQKKTKSKAKEV